MSIPSHLLDAFYSVAQNLSFTRASEELCVTQSALSQRIKQLELELDTVLFVRSRSGVKLTESAHKLLEYCQIRRDLEREIVSQIKSDDKKKLSGVLRVAAQSSILYPVVIPSLDKFLRQNPSIQIEFYSAQMSDLPEMLFQLQSDFVFLDHESSRQDCEKHIVGHEELVLIQSKKYKSRESTYIDIGPTDNITELFFSKQSKSKTKKNINRSFISSEMGLIEGVSRGLGQAVVTKHSIPKGAAVEIDKRYKSVKHPVVLHYRKKPFYSLLHKQVLEQLVLNIKKLLH